MPRPRRLEPAGVTLHVIQRGNNRAACFYGDIDRNFYLKCLREYSERRSCAIHAYALMSNHVHLLVTPAEEGGVSLMLQDLGRHYVRVVNNAHERTGTLWEGRFKSNLIDSETYLFTCHRYIELNPVRAGMVSTPADYHWSSHTHYARGRTNNLISEHPAYLELGATAEVRRFRFLSLFDEPLKESELTNLRMSVNKGLALGSEQFLDQLEAKLGKSVRPARRGRPPKELPDSPDEMNGQAEMLL